MLSWQIRPNMVFVVLPTVTGYTALGADCDELVLNCIPSTSLELATAHQWLL